MFRVRGEKKEDHQYHVDLILKVSEHDVGAALVIAEVYFEWCIRRCILALGQTPTKDLRKKLSAPLNFEKLLELWKDEVVRHDGESVIPCLPKVFDLRKKKPCFGKLVLTWRDIDRARQKRNSLVHGARCSPGSDGGMAYIKLLIAASNVLVSLAEEHGHSIFRVLQRRRSLGKD